MISGIYQTTLPKPPFVRGPLQTAARSGRRGRKRTPQQIKKQQLFLDILAAPPEPLKSKITQDSVNTGRNASTDFKPGNVSAAPKPQTTPAAARRTAGGDTAVLTRPAGGAIRSPRLERLAGQVPHVIDEEDLRLMQMRRDFDSGTADPQVAPDVQIQYGIPSPIQLVSQRPSFMQPSPVEEQGSPVEEQGAPVEEQSSPIGDAMEGVVPSVGEALGGLVTEGAQAVANAGGQALSGAAQLGGQALGGAAQLGGQALSGAAGLGAQAVGGLANLGGRALQGAGTHFMNSVQLALDEQMDAVRANAALAAQRQAGFLAEERERAARAAAEEQVRAGRAAELQAESARQQAKIAELQRAANERRAREVAINEQMAVAQRAEEQAKIADLQRSAREREAKEARAGKAKVAEPRVDNDVVITPAASGEPSGGGGPSRNPTGRRRRTSREGAVTTEGPTARRGSIGENEFEVTGDAVGAPLEQYFVPARRSRSGNPIFALTKQGRPKVAYLSPQFKNAYKSDPEIRKRIDDFRNGFALNLPK